MDRWVNLHIFTQSYYGMLFGDFKNLDINHWLTPVWRNLKKKTKKKTLWWQEEAKYKIMHTLWFHLNKFLEQAK